MGSGEGLEQALKGRARAAGRRARGGDILDAALDAAFETDPEQRVWRLVVVAARLRDEQDYERALSVLDRAVSIAPLSPASAAAFTTAAAIHCDRGDLATARAICDQQMLEGVDEAMLKVAARVYWELFKSTKLPEFRARWESCSRALEAFAAAPAS